MNSTIKEYELLLKNFELNKLDKITEKRDSTIKIAIAALVNTLLWRDDSVSTYLIKSLPSKNTSPLIEFCKALTYLSIGELNNFKAMYNNLLKDSRIKKWQKEWLQIEFLGRTLQEEKQIDYLRKLYYKDKVIYTYLVGAVLQTTMHTKVNLYYLKEFTLELIRNNDKNINAISAFSIRCNILEYNNYNEKYNLSNLYLANYLFAEQKDSIKCLKVLDKLAKNNFLDINALNRWLALSTLLPQAKESNLNRINYAYTNFSKNFSIQAMISSYFLIYYFMIGDYKTVYKIGKQYELYIQMNVNDSLKNSKIYFTYILRLCLEWQNNRGNYNINKKNIYVYGESHSLATSNVDISLFNNNMTATVNLIIGIKMYHLSNPTSNYLASIMSDYIKLIDNNKDILFTIGEIDTRPKEGIWLAKTSKGLDLKETIEKTVGGYIDFLSKELSNKLMNSITIQGIPAPGYELIDERDPGDEIGFLSMIMQVNEKLKELTLKQGWNFLDVYSATSNSKGKSNMKWHIDDFHLKSSFYTQADKWLIKPEIKKEEIKPVAIDFSKYSTVSLSKPS